ncbi:MAG: D-glycero-beta-D-manno-heptose 1-phosphate adenylyltransferase [Candidatus Omnitrophica bacterium]|nr:D-glycero-beta-D-manno-heptose 1-phosphate adenylyltransferase [Candidatus Omnitrophota bacterium]
MRTDRAGALFRDKIKEPAALRKIIAGLKTRGKKIVFTNGCFDLLHYGHASYLQQARRRGDILIVAVNSDASVRKIKGCRRPIISQKDRMKLVAALESVDYVVSFDARTPLNLIKLFIPDVLVKGADWDKESIVGGSFVRGQGGKVLTLKLAKGHSTSNLIKRIAENYR